MLVKNLRIYDKLSLMIMATLTVGFTSAAFYFGEWVLLAIPFALLVAVWCLLDIVQVFFLLCFLLPLSVEFHFSNGFSTDLPTEPLTVMLMFAFIAYVLYKPSAFDFGVFKNPLLWFLLLHLCWIGITAIHSIEPFLSFKYLLAKCWYVSVFLFMAFFVFRKQEHIKTFFWCVYVPLISIALVAIVRFALLNFSFEYVNRPVQPFFRNKVNYATMLALFYPYLFVAASWYDKGSWKRNLIQLGKVIFLVGIYFSYTRAAYLALVVALLTVFIVRWRMIKAVTIGALIVVACIAVYFVHNNTYLNYAPDFRKTVHHDSWDDHLISTFQGEDASSMERVHMWIGGIFMSTQHPLMGSGPNTFYPEYKRYTVTRFETYLSDNDEHLTIHNYFLLVLVEQGIIGLLLWLCIVIGFLWMAEKTYHALREPALKKRCMVSICVHVIMLVSLTLSDLVEVDKTGSLFFINMALMLNLWMISRKPLSESAP